MELHKDEQVFEAVRGILVSPDFHTAQMSFMNGNIEKFDENEENKLEYTAIYESYVEIIESLIDSNLNTKGFVQEEVQNFYEDFAAHSKKYEAIDAETCKTLFNFTDFVRFKNEMLTRKRAVSNDKAIGVQEVSTQDKAADDAMMRRFLQEDPNDPANGWNKRVEVPRKDSYEAKVYSKKVEGYRMEWIMSDMVFDNATVFGYESFFSDVKNTLGSASLMKKLVVISKYDDGSPEMIYARVSLAFFLSDRENLVHFKKTHQEDGSLILTACSGQHPDYPLNDEAIRVSFYLGANARQIDGNLHLREIKMVDPKGYVPAGLFNTVIATKQREFIGIMAKKMKQ